MCYKNGLGVFDRALKEVRLRYRQGTHVRPKGLAGVGSPPLMWQTSSACNWAYVSIIRTERPRLNGICIDGQSVSKRNISGRYLLIPLKKAAGVTTA